MKYIKLQNPHEINRWQNELDLPDEYLLTTQQQQKLEKYLSSKGIQSEITENHITFWTSSNSHSNKTEKEIWKFIEKMLY